MTEPCLVILAAGMGSRFGGLKQMSPVGQADEWLLEFSLYDAFKAGFRKLIFVVRPEMRVAFERQMTCRLGGYFDLYFAEQNMNTGFSEVKWRQFSEPLSQREKPLGTAHALLSALPLISGPFAVINADDYYGPSAYQELWPFLKRIGRRAKGIVPQPKGMIAAFELARTLSEAGPVSRGICTVDADGHLSSVNECSALMRDENQRITDEFGNTYDDAQLISMNIWGFNLGFKSLLQEAFQRFIDHELTLSPLKAEFYLPSAVAEAIKMGHLTVTLKVTRDQWLGMTYGEDLAWVRRQIGSAQSVGHYPVPLWQPEGMSAWQAATHFFHLSDIESLLPINAGHINQTYCMTLTAPQHKLGQKFVLQRINTQVFKQPMALMPNIIAVTRHLKARLSKGERTIELVNTLDGEAWLIDDQLGHWRCYKYIEPCRVLSETANLTELYEVGKGFGNFSAKLADFPAEQLKAVIPDFHNTPLRFAQLKKAIDDDSANRRSAVDAELLMAYRFAPYLDVITSALKTGEVPLRVTHNDTKVNNALMDANTGKCMAIIDLDTVMAGSLLYDFGDGIRSSASTSAEDALDFQQTRLDLDRFKAFSRGFLSEVLPMLTEGERRLLVFGPIMMTYECGIRFLTDYLSGDVYFKINREHQNLDRARTQLTLALSMLAERETLTQILETLIAEWEVEQHADIG